MSQGVQFDVWEQHHRCNHQQEQRGRQPAQPCPPVCQLFTTACLDAAAGCPACTMCTYPSTSQLTRRQHMRCWRRSSSTCPTLGSSATPHTRSWRCTPRSGWAVTDTLYPGLEPTPTPMPLLLRRPASSNSSSSWSSEDAASGWPPLPARLSRYW